MYFINLAFNGGPTSHTFLNPAPERGFISVGWRKGGSKSRFRYFWFYLFEPILFELFPRSPMNQTFGYVGSSRPPCFSRLTESQHPAQALQMHGCDCTYQGKVSGTDLHRPALDELPSSARESDTVVTVCRCRIQLRPVGSEPRPPDRPGPGQSQGQARRSAGHNTKSQTLKHDSSRQCVRRARPAAGGDPFSPTYSPAHRGQGTPSRPNRPIFRPIV